MLSPNYIASCFQPKSNGLCHHPSLQLQLTKIKDAANTANLGQGVFLICSSSLQGDFHWSSNSALLGLTWGDSQDTVQRMYSTVMNKDF